MAKDGNAGRKGSQDKSKGKGQKRKERGPPAKASKAILKLGQPPVSEQTTSLRLEDAIGNEVKEKLDCWRDGDNGQILIQMLVKSIEVSNNYSLYNEEGQWQAVVQAISRVLSGRCQKEFNTLVREINNWTTAGASKHKKLVRKLCEKVFKKKPYKYQKNAMRQELPYKGHDHR